MILEGPWYAQAIKTALALLLIGTFVWRMLKKEWWWEALRKKK
jgi:hypothetical protein